MFYFFWEDLHEQKSQIKELKLTYMKLVITADLLAFAMTFHGLLRAFNYIFSLKHKVDIC